MNAILLSLPGETGKALARELAIPLYYRKPSHVTHSTYVIRWGSRAYFPHRNTINTPEAIQKVSDKKACRKYLAAEGFPVPTLSETMFPVIGRPSHHMGGRKFYVCRTPYEVQRAKRRGATYFSQFYPKTEEYRVHIAGGKVILLSEKMGNKRKRIWNHHINDFTLRHMQRFEWLEDPFLMRMQRMMKEVMENLKLDFAAIDVMAKPTDSSLPEFVIAEVNTAPALSPLALEKYVNFFRNTIDKTNNLC